MLQQTQVDRVKIFYKNFIRRFPTLPSLAEVEWEEVYPLWRGLGYYSRAKNLLKTAKVIHSQHSGKFPLEYSELRKLPGIGDYTANAILAFTRNKKVAAIDTNLKRVLERVAPDVDAAESAIRLMDRPSSNPRELHYALMDLGASLCRSTRTDCSLCPLRNQCKSAFVEIETRTVLRKKKPQLKDVGVACIHSDSKFLVGKRPKRKGGAWEFPGGKREPGEDIRSCIKREIEEELGVEVSVRPPFHVEELLTDGLRLHFCRCQIQLGEPTPLEHSELQWVTPSKAQKLLPPTSNLRVLEILLGK